MGQRLIAAPWANVPLGRRRRGAGEVNLNSCIMRSMGLVSAKVTLSNPRKPHLAPVEAEALADSGSVPALSCVPLSLVLPGA